MEGATATFAMFVPEPVAPADLGIAQAYYEVCAQRMMEELPEEDKLEMSFIQDYFTDFVFEGNHKKCISTCVFTQICLNFSIFLR